MFLETCVFSAAVTFSRQTPSRDPPVSCGAVAEQRNPTIVYYLRVYSEETTNPPTQTRYVGTPSSQFKSVCFINRADATKTCCQMAIPLYGLPC